MITTLSKLLYEVIDNIHILYPDSEEYRLLQLKTLSLALLIARQWITLQESVFITSK
jgi:hypothetical protein